MPLELASGEALALPEVLALGDWAALLTGTAFLAIYARRVTDETFSMSQALAATQMALAREQQLSALGGVVAAAAHELGTPLATIKLAATELVEELADRPHLQEDARWSAPRPTAAPRSCGRWGRAARRTRWSATRPFSSVVEEAAAPHADRGIRIITRIEGAPLEDGPEVQPLVARRPEIIQGLRNLVQNAVDFARSTVWIDLDWSETELRVAIGDDGRGYPPDLIGRIGEPFVRRRAGPAGRAAGLRGHGARALHRQDPARAQRRDPELRQRHAGGRARPARVRPAERRRRHRRLAARARSRPARRASARRQRAGAGLRRAAAVGRSRSGPTAGSRPRRLQRAQG